MVSISDLPGINAILNSISALLLITGLLFIKQRNITAHKACMITAFITSLLFLISYLTYHAHIGSKHFTGQGWIRPIYFTVLVSHTVLAVIVPPLALMTLYRAWKEQFTKHIKLAKWTLPIWLYVSVTGVMVYWMLYKM
jgi:uncharacterized membrane protein YozB (DUF420 family)